MAIRLTESRLCQIICEELNEMSKHCQKGTQKHLILKNKLFAI